MQNIKTNKVSFKSKKYRAILISIFLFIILDASILITNFWLSFQIEKDTTALNVAGRQRMLSQQIPKSLYEFKLLRAQQIIGFRADRSSDREARVNELKDSASLFDSSLKGLKNGGDVINTDGKLISIFAMNSPRTISSVNEGLAIWEPYKKFLDKFFEDFEKGETRIFTQNLEKYSQENNLKLLSVMDNLTSELDTIAKSKTNLLRQIQVFGILLAFVNFLILTFHFIKKLTASDKEIAAAQKETSQILETVDQGLFLLDKDLNIADKHSNKLLEIFDKENVTGEQLPTLLKNMISDKDQRNTEKFVTFLFDKRKKARLLGDLNPLKEVLVQIHSAKRTLKKYLSFDFKRVEETDGELSRILISVSDITSEVELRERLKLLEKESEKSIDILRVILSCNSKMLDIFLENAIASYSYINELLKQESNTTSEYMKVCDQALSAMHKIKGEANALSIDELSSLGHQFEVELKRIQEKSKIYGQHFVPLTVTLEKMTRYTENLIGLQNKFNTQMGVSELESKPFQSIRENWGHLYSLADKIADRQKKSIDFIASGLNDYYLSDKLINYINTVCSQLIRNSISHGIDTPNNRRKYGKPEKGLVQVRLVMFANNDIKIVFKDDGKGLDTNLIGEKAIDAGIVTREQLTSMNAQKIINLLFHSGFSTTSDEKANEDYGHGIGLSLVKEQTEELDGKISIRSNKNKGTKFSFFIPAS